MTPNDRKGGGLVLLNGLCYDQVKGGGFMDKKTQILHLIFSVILLFCSTIILIKNYLNIPEWLYALTGLFLIIELILLIVVVIRMIQHRKNK